MLGTAVPWLAVFISVAIIVIQRATITNLQNQLAPTWRTKRSLDLQKSVYVPVYAQISEKALHRLCMEKHYSDIEAANYKKMAIVTTTTTAVTKAATRKLRKSRLHTQRKKCSTEMILSDPNPIGTRPNNVGGAMRDGSSYYLTEFTLGYSILMFPSIRSLNQSEPKSLITLPYPFHGTDNTVFNNTVYYSYGDTIVSFNMFTGETKQIRLNVSEGALYKNASSTIDLQADEHGIWMLYRQNDEDYLTATRIHSISLKMLSSWSLRAVHPNHLCKAIVRCGLLYTLECADNNVIISAVYDFYTNRNVNGRQMRWRGMNNLSSAQYDPRSKTITIFDNGVVYTVSAV